MANSASKERLAGAFLFILAGWAMVAVFVGTFFQMSDLLGSRTPLPPPLSAGTEAPQFKLESLKGEMVSLSQFKGRPVLAMFWSAG